MKAFEDQKDFVVDEQQFNELYSKGAQGLVMRQLSPGVWYISSYYIRQERIELKDFTQDKIVQLVLENHHFTNLGINFNNWLEKNNLPKPTFKIW